MACKLALIILVPTGRASRRNEVLLSNGVSAAAAWSLQPPRGGMGGRGGKPVQVGRIGDEDWLMWKTGCGKESERMGKGEVKLVEEIN